MSWFQQVEAALQGTAAHMAESTEGHLRFLEWAAGHKEEVYQHVAGNVAASAQGTYWALEHAAGHRDEIFQQVAGNVAASAHGTFKALEFAIGELVKHGQAAFEDIKKQIEHLVKGIQDFDWGQIPQAILDYINKNRKITILQLACLLAVIFPQLVATPALLALGFGPRGLIAGWLASAFQSISGTNVAFSVLQSAAMGGYGVPIVHGIIAVGALGAVAGLEVCKWQHEEKQDEGEEKKDD